MANNQPLNTSEPQPALQTPCMYSADLNAGDRPSLTPQDSFLSGIPSAQTERDYDSYRYRDSPDIEGKGLVKETQHKLYERRWIGLAELTLLNFAIGWGYAAPGVVSTTATKWFNISFQELNWLSIAGSLVFLVPAPFTIWILNRYGPKFAITTACVLTVIGNWIIYGAARAHNFPVHILGTIVHSLSSPFIMASPTRYSRMWFGDQGRTFATALPSLAYPLGAGVGALSGAYMVKPLGPLNYDGQALIIAIVFTAAAIPAPFIPKCPPTPPSHVATTKRLAPVESINHLIRNPTFYLQFISFSIFAGAIDTITSITNQAIKPYGYRQVDAGYAIAFLIFVGIVFSLILSPILDRTKGHLIALKIIVFTIAGAFTALPFIPQTKSAAALYVIFAVIGASSLSVEPCVLEFQASWTHPVSPEFSSVICWSGAKVMVAVLTILVGNALVLKTPAEGQPAGSLFNGFVLIAVLCWCCVPCAWLNGWGWFKRPEVSKVEGND